MTLSSKYVKNLMNALKDFEHNELERIIQVVEKAIKLGNNIFMCGNGGSAANPSHSAGDWSKELYARTTCLSDNIASLTAWANDSDYSKVFVSQLKTYFNDGDILLAFSGSGNSANVINAIKFVNTNHGTTIGFTGNYKGMNGGKLAQLANHSMVFDTESMEIIEDMQLIACHIIKETLKERRK